MADSLQDDNKRRTRTYVPRDDSKNETWMVLQTLVGHWLIQSENVLKRDVWNLVSPGTGELKETRRLSAASIRVFVNRAGRVGLSRL